MTWTFIIVLILAGLIKVVMTCLPTSVVETLISKFEVHPTLNKSTVTVSINGKILDDKTKNQIIDNFNEALFLEKYYYVPVETSETSFTITSTITKKRPVRYFVYSYDDHVDVIKKHNKKEIAYSVRSDFLQEFQIKLE